jgi:putative addiction module antidote
MPMIELKLRRIGDSLTVVLPQEAIERLNVDDGDRLILTEAPDGGYRLARSDPAHKAKMAKAEDIFARYPNTLRALAK